MSTKVLIIGAHNDECDYGCGGITALLAQKGCDVHYLNVACFWHKDDATEEEIARWEAEEQEAVSDRRIRNCIQSIECKKRLCIFGSIISIYKAMEMW